MNYDDYLEGAEGLILGNGGLVNGFFRGYVYDLYNQSREVANREFAESLGLEYFIYEGSVIPNTRDFCRSKAGKVFTTKEAAKWVNDPDLIDKKTKSTYQPLIERGRYNCRHWLNYISEEIAFQLRPELKNFV